MWDFTVRGWRQADITGIKHHFNGKEVVEAQKPVKHLIFKDTKIGKYSQIVGPNFGTVENAGSGYILVSNTRLLIYRRYTGIDKAI